LQQSVGLIQMYLLVEVKINQLLSEIWELRIC